MSNNPYKAPTSLESPVEIVNSQPDHDAGDFTLHAIAGVVTLLVGICVGIAVTLGVAITWSEIKHSDFVASIGVSDDLLSPSVITGGIIFAVGLALLVHVILLSVITRLFGLNQPSLNDPIRAQPTYDKASSA